MSKPRPKQKEEPVKEANLIPVLSCMFLLIPALLLAMEVASMSAITVNPPLTTSRPSAQRGEETLKFRVMVRSDGFEADVKRGAMTQGTPKSIPMRTDSGEAAYDYAALTEYAREIKQLFPDEEIVTVTAEGDIAYQTLVDTMDALRGTDCSLIDTAAGEQAPPECLFFRVVVES